MLSNLIAGKDEGASTLETQESLQRPAIDHVAEGVERNENRVSSLHPLRGHFQLTGHSTAVASATLGPRDESRPRRAGSPTFAVRARKNSIIWLTVRDHRRARPAKRVCPLLHGQGSAYLVAKRANHTSIPASDLLNQMDIPDFLSNLAAHPHFKDRPWDRNALTNFDLWDSARVRIPASTFAPEARVARVFAISGLARKNRPGLAARSDAILYRSTDADIDHEDATVHGE